MIPAKPYMHKVMLWAMANGKSFFTMKDQMKALASYEIFAASKN